MKNLIRSAVIVAAAFIFTTAWAWGRGDRNIMLAGVCMLAVAWAAARGCDYVVGRWEIRQQRKDTELEQAWAVAHPETAKRHAESRAEIAKEWANRKEDHVN